MADNRSNDDPSTGATDPAGALAVSKPPSRPAAKRSALPALTTSEHVELVESGADHVRVAGSMSIRQGGVNIAEAGQIDVHQGGISRAQADDIAVTQGGIGLARGNRVSVDMGAVGLALGGEVRVTQGYARSILARDVRIEQAGARTIIAGTARFERNSGTLMLIAGRVEGNVRTVLDWRGALAFGAALGLVMGLFRLRR